MKYEFNLSVSIHTYDGRRKRGRLYIKREEDDKLLTFLRYMM